MKKQLNTIGNLRIFKDSTLNQQFIEYGYVKLQLFNNKECSKIKKTTTNIINEETNTDFDFMTVPNQSTTYEKCQQVHSYFKQILEEKIYNYLTNDFIFFNSCLFYKKPRSKELLWHKDPTFYNMGENNTIIGIWAGIEKTTKRNGCFRVVPKSHKLSFNYEAFPFKPLGETANTLNLKGAYSQLIDKYAVDIPLKKGEVIIHDYAILHASHPNNSYFKKRIAYKVNLYPKKAENYEIAYYHSDKNKLEVFGVSKETLKNNSSVFNNYSNIEELILNNKLWLIKEEQLQHNSIPFSSLEEMETIMNTQKKSLKAQFKTN